LERRYKTDSPLCRSSKGGRPNDTLPSKRCAAVAVSFTQQERAADAARHTVIPAGEDHIYQLRSSDRHRESPGDLAVLHAMPVAPSRSISLPVAKNQLRSRSSRRYRPKVFAVRVFLFVIPGGVDGAMCVLSTGRINLETIMSVPGNDPRNSLAIVCGLRKPKDVFMAIILARLSQWLVQ
jgi:hypothetical protein